MTRWEHFSDSQPWRPLHLTQIRSDRSVSLTSRNSSVSTNPLLPLSTAPPPTRMLPSSIPGARYSLPWPWRSPRRRQLSPAPIGSVTRQPLFSSVFSRIRMVICAWFSPSALLIYPLTLVCFPDQCKSVIMCKVCFVVEFRWWCSWIQVRCRCQEERQRKGIGTRKKRHCERPRRKLGLNLVWFLLLLFLNPLYLRYNSDPFTSLQLE